MLEAVPNVSEGRDERVLAALAEACGNALLDVHCDVDHHRSVFTLCGLHARDTEGASRQLARAVARQVSIEDHQGVHPRLGALDLMPFIALGARLNRQAAIDAAHSFARWWSEAFEVPCFVYDDAHPEGRSLPVVRRGAFQHFPPDYGPTLAHPTLGATAVGARPPLVALNCLLVTRDVSVARRIARAVRESDGGLPGVRALGLSLDAVGRAQVSMNLVDLERTGVQDAVVTVRELARGEATDVASVELVGLVPAAELDRCSDDFVRWAGIDATQTIESRVAARS